VATIFDRRHLNRFICAFDFLKLTRRVATIDYEMEKMGMRGAITDWHVRAKPDVGPYPQSPSGIEHFAANRFKNAMFGAEVAEPVLGSPSNH
jgi:hypothetical protein